MPVNVFTPPPYTPKIPKPQAVTTIGAAHLASGWLTAEESAWLYAQGMAHATLAVGNDGIAAHYLQGDPVGSYRASAWMPTWADAWFTALPEDVKRPRVVTDMDHLDAPVGSCWRAVGVNPLFRWIAYPPQTGQLVAHYDAPYEQTPHHKTLTSFLVYLTDTEMEGQTRFLYDSQDTRAKPFRDWSDWNRSAHPHEVQHTIRAHAGDVLWFDHRLLHDSTPMGTTRKMVVRTDILYERIT